MKSPRFLLLATSALAVAILAQDKQLQHPDSGSDEDFGRVHMDISCPLAVAAEFDRALAFVCTTFGMCVRWSDSIKS